MKFYLLTLFLLLGKGQDHAQACREINIAPDSLKRRILTEYARENYQLHYFQADKGIIELTAYTNAKGDLEWRLLASIDDRY